MALETPYRAITACLRTFTAQVPRVTWGSTASPFYKQAPEPVVAFPYVVYDLAFSSIEHVMMSGSEGGSYAEKRALTIKVYGDSDEIEQAAAPEWENSLCNYLDGLADEPQYLNGLNFQCIQFLRNGYELLQEERRDETGVAWIWCAHATYEFWTNVPYPIRRN